MDAMNDDLLRRAAARYGMAAATLTHIGGMDSAVYAYEHKGQGYVLRLTPCSMAQIPRIHGELAFMDYLRENRMPVARPVPSLGGNMVEILESDDGMIAVSSLERAAGRPVEPRDPAEWNDAFFTRWGRAMGRIHALTRRYRPAHPHADWRAEHDDLAAACGDADILARWNHLGDTIRGLPQPTDAYGLVHNDLHPWNFFIHHDELVLFDFGSCAHNWFVADIAIPMYWAAWAGTTHAGESPLDYLRRFAHHFMAGYEGENGLDRQWLEHLPLFMKHRQILLFIYFSYARSVNPWLRAHLLGDAERMIRADEPVIDGVFW